MIQLYRVLYARYSIEDTLRPPLFLAYLDFAFLLTPSFGEGVSQNLWCVCVKSSFSLWTPLCWIVNKNNTINFWFASWLSPLHPIHLHGCVPVVCPFFTHRDGKESFNNFANKLYTFPHSVLRTKKKVLFVIQQRLWWHRAFPFFLFA